VADGVEMTMAEGIDPERLDYLRDITAALRAFTADDVTTANEITRRHWGDPAAEASLTRELLELVSGLLAIADDIDLKAETLVAHMIKEVPANLAPRYEAAGTLLIALVRETEEASQDLEFTDSDEHERFVKVMLNYGAFFARTIGERVGPSADEVLELVARRLGVL
jgi:hypothetical protein